MKENEIDEGRVSAQRAEDQQITPPHIRQNKASDASKSNAQKYLRRKFGDFPVQWLPLGEVIEIYTGKQFNKTDMLSIGTYPVINGGVNPSGFAEVYNEEEDTITISQVGASAGYVNWMNCKFFAGAHCYVVRPINDEINNRYLYHFFKSNESNLMKSQHGAGIPALKREIVKSILIPIPPMDEQERIVGILDKFDTLTNSLTEGIPKEIEMRQMQYEYYRDALLSFCASAD